MSQTTFERRADPRSSARLSVARDHIDDDQEVPEEQKLNWKQVAFFTFVCTSGGAFGIEDALQSGGPAISLFLITFMPLFFMIPVCMILQEFAEWMPTSHGTIRWVRRGLGDRAGFVNAILQAFVNLIDLSTYPVLSTNYLFRHFAPHANFGLVYAVRISVIIGGGMLCLFEISAVAKATMVLTILIVVPFLVGSGMAFPEAFHHTNLWGETSSHLHYASLFSIGMWIYGGFLGNGSLSAEVKKGALIRGQLLAMFLGWAMYVIPVCAIVHVQPHWSKWDGGYLGQAFGLVKPALGTVIALAGVCSGIGQYISNLSCYCRTMWGVADLGWLPTPLARKNRFGVPFIAVGIHVLSSAILGLFKFDFLINVEFCFATFLYLIFVVAFITLRYTEPDAERGYRIPGPTYAAILLTVPMCIFAGGAFGSTIMDWRIALIFVGFIALLVAIFVLVVRRAERAAMSERLLAAPDQAKDEAGASTHRNINSSDLSP